MTGTVSWDTLGWVLGLAAAVCSAVVGAIFWVQAQLQRDREALNKHKDDFHAFKEKVARDYVTSETLRQMEGKMQAGFDRLGDRFDAVMQKLMGR